MCAAAIETEDEVPSLLWGLNPIFSSFARLYIKDILEMKESKQVPVDDGTGVISCTCWKNALAEKKNMSADLESQPSTLSGLNLSDLIRNLQIAIRKKTILEIGDLIRVRGCIRIYRQQREIKASVYYKVDDPMYETQISRMLELPRLYKDIYDKQFQFPEETQCNHGASDELGSVMNLSKKIRDFLLRNKIPSFYMQELETVEDLVSLAKQNAEQTGSKAGPCSRLIRKSFMEAIELLQKDGVLFQKSKTSQNMYYVTEQDTELHKVTLEVIRADCKRPKYAEKGCHLRHILSCIQQSYNPYITEAVVRCLLDWLEINSEVVTTMEEYYTVF
ncbi:CST complex subunit STN1 isoform X4 [Pantherophis guttatus]|uniref:CST complex subunit STN1 n=1 Tax=Pantherophis guttatus TaxID=94885 RepID=A0A6P9DXY4_PANGU|nr:CST complex subunit STN1 isoform X4 [Pantherophis guttatus]